MSTTPKKAPSDQAQLALAQLKSAVTETLNQKRKLGQYAVAWDGKQAVKIKPGNS